MKKTLPIALILLLLSFTKEKEIVTLKYGMIGIKNELVVDETEITVGEWLEFISYQDHFAVKKYLSGFVIFVKGY